MAHDCWHDTGACLDGHHEQFGHVFRARLVRSSGPLGLVLAVHAQITGIGIAEVDQANSEIIQTWNQQNPEQCIQAKCAILEVNGHRDALAMADELKESQVLDLLICPQLTEWQAWAVERTLAKRQRSKAINAVLTEGTPNPEEACSICHEDMPCDVVRLPCQHQFHGACIKKWLMQHPRCPLCNDELEL